MTHQRSLSSPFHPALSAFVVAGLLLSACGDGSGKPSAERAPRRFLDAEWTPAFEVRSDVNDTIFQYLSDVGIGRDRVYALDLYANRVVAFDTLGNALWSVGREGGGPGEFRGPQRLVVAPDGRVWIYDPEIGRLTVLSPDGHLVDTINLSDLPESPGDVMVLSGDSILVTLRNQKEPFWILDRSGHPTASLPHPMALFRKTDPFTRQMWIAADPSSSAWAAGFSMTDGLVTFRGHEPAGWGWYPEPIQPPVVLRTKTEGDGRTVFTTRLATRPVYGALALAVTDSTVMVLFAGRSERRLRILDVYGLEDGAYRGTIPLPWPSETMARYGDRFVFLYNDPVPTIRVARLRLPGGD